MWCDEVVKKLISAALSFQILPILLYIASLRVSNLSLCCFLPTAPLSMSFSLLLLQPISLSCTVVLNALSWRRCLLWTLSTPRTPVFLEISILTCGSTTGALHSTWMRPCLSSGPAFWSELLRPLPLQM